MGGIIFSAIVTPPLTINWTVKTGDFDYNCLIKNFINESGFIAGYVYDYEDVSWQSEKSISEYELNGIDHTRIPKVKDEWDNIIIDVSKNSGRETLLKNMWLMASPKIWLSDLFFEITGINKTYLSTHPGANEIQKGIIKIDLFDDIFSSMENRQEQEDFRKLAGFEKIEKQLYPY